MARTIAQITSEIKAVYVSQRALAGLPFDDPDNWSIFSYKALWAGIVAIACWTRDKYDDLFRAEIDQEIATKVPHTEQWYAEMAKEFQYGYDLASNNRYDNTGLTAEEVAASKIVKQAAVEEQKRGIRIKVARLIGDELGPLTDAQMLAFFTASRSYIKRRKDAGVKVLVTTGEADSLKLKLLIKFNPLVLNSLGQRIDGTNNEPVQTAVKSYLKNLPFNGRLELDKLVDEMQKVEGVVAAYVQQATARYGALPYTSFVNYLYEPDAGYMKFYDDADLQTEFILN